MIKGLKIFHGKKTAVMALVMLLGITGCAGRSNGAFETVISLTKSGTVQSCIAETFEQNYYDKDELQQMILAEAASYNRQAGEAHISVEKVEVRDGLAVVQMSYTNATDYATFNQVTFFEGTPQQAQEDGYDLNVVLSSSKNPQETIGKADILAMENVKIMITDVEEKVRIQGSILYASDNAVISSKRKVFQRMPDSDKVTYIIYKN